MVGRGDVLDIDRVVVANVLGHWDEDDSAECQA